MGQQATFDLTQDEKKVLDLLLLVADILNTDTVDDGYVSIHIPYVPQVAH